MNNKKKIRIIFAVFSIILLSLNYCFSQDTTIIYTKDVYPYFQSGNAYFEKNAKIFPSKPGPFIIYTEVKYLDTTLQFKWLQGELAPGGMTGKWTCWHLNGIKSWEASFFKNTHTSKEYFYSPSGTLISEYEWVDGLAINKHIRERKKLKPGFYTSNKWQSNDSIIIEQKFDENNDTLQVIKMYRSHKDKLWKTRTISYRNNLPARIGYSNKPAGSSNNDILQPLINNTISIWDTGDTTYKSKINDVTSMPQINNIYLYSLNENEKQIINDLEKSFKKFNLTKSVKTIVLKSESKNLSKIPEFIFQCDSLEALEITANIKSLPKKLSKLTQIKILQIEASGGIDIRKAIKILRKLPNLRSLTIVNTKEHLIPIEINQLTNLVTLNLDHSKRDRNGNLFPLPKELYELKKLNYLEVPQEIINAKLLYSNIPDCLFIYTRPQTK